MGEAISTEDFNIARSKCETLISLLGKIRSVETWVS